MFAEMQDSVLRGSRNFPTFTTRVLSTPHLVTISLDLDERMHSKVETRPIILEGEIGVSIFSHSTIRVAVPKKYIRYWPVCPTSLDVIKVWKRFIYVYYWNIDIERTKLVIWKSRILKSWKKEKRNTGSICMYSWWKFVIVEYMLNRNRHLRITFPERCLTIFWTQLLT